MITVQCTDSVVYSAALNSCIKKCF